MVREVDFCEKAAQDGNQQIRFYKNRQDEQYLRFFSNNDEFISVFFSVFTGNANMEATVRQYEDNFELTADVSRINKYGNQSHCISDPFYARYCYCRDLLPSESPPVSM